MDQKIREDHRLTMAPGEIKAARDERARIIRILRKIGRLHIDETTHHLIGMLLRGGPYWEEVKYPPPAETVRGASRSIKT